MAVEGDEFDTDELMKQAPGWMLSGGKRTASDTLVGEAAKRAAREKSSGSAKQEDVIKKLVLLLGALCLSNASTLREVTGAIFHTFLIPIGHKIAVELKATGVKYHEEVEQKGRKEHDLGPPYLHIWTTLIRVLHGLSTTAPRDKLVLQAYWVDVVCKKPRDELIDQVRHCRMRITYKQDFGKLSIAMATTSMEFKPQEATVTLEMAIIAAISAAGGQRKAGPPPPSALEREARQLLEKVKKAA